MRASCLLCGFMGTSSRLSAFLHTCFAGLGGACRAFCGRSAYMSWVPFVMPFGFVRGGSSSCPAGSLIQMYKPLVNLNKNLKELSMFSGHSSRATTHTVVSLTVPHPRASARRVRRGGGLGRSGIRRHGRPTEPAWGCVGCRLDQVRLLCSAAEPVDI